MNTVAYNKLLKTAEKILDKNFAPQEKIAFLPALKAIQPYAGKAFQGAKNLMSNSWKGMSGIDKTLAVGLPAATTLPTMFDKQDDQGRSRAERLTTTGGNIAGGLLGQGIGGSIGKSITKAIPGSIGRGLSTVSSIAGAMGGSMLGEKATSAPLNVLKPKPNNNSTQGYALQQNNAPQQNVIQ